MAISLRAFITHKKSELFSDCQDSFSINTDNKTIAISDGISQSIFPKLWAKLLTDEYCKHIIDYEKKESFLRNEELLNTLREEWLKQVKEIKHKKEINGEQTWRLENSLNMGKSAGATFLGIKFDSDIYNFEVLGDSCLFEINKDNEMVHIISSKPENEAFNNNPDYIDSNHLSKLIGEPIIDNRDIPFGGAFLMVTDAIADWICKNKNENNFFNELLEIKDQEQFEEYINIQRKNGMTNDDSTMVIIKFDNKNNGEIIIEYKTSIDDLINEERRTNTHFNG